MPMQEDPFNHVCNRTEDKRSRSETCTSERAKSTKYLPLHFMPKRKRSSGCAAMLRYAASTSNFAINAPDPYLEAMRII